MQMNIDFQNNLGKTICWILSLISWLLFILTGWIGFFKLSIKKYENGISYNNIWSFINFYIEGNNSDKTTYYPIQTKLGFYIFLFALLMICGTIAFVFYIIKSMFKKDDHVFEGMMGTFARYHFVPITCASALFIIGMTQKTNLTLITNDPNTESVSKYFEEVKKYFNSFAVSLSFSIIGLISSVFIKMQTKIEQPYYIVYTIKDGVYSMFISLFTYCIFYSSIYVGVFNKVKKAYNIVINNIIDLSKSLQVLASIPKFMKDCGIAFSLIIGIINISIGIFLNDIGIPAINFIIYLGFTVYFFLINKDDRENEGISDAEGIIDIIILVVSCAGIAFILFNKFKVKNK